MPKGSVDRRRLACNLSVAGFVVQSRLAAGVLGDGPFLTSSVLAEVARQVSGARVLLVADRALVRPLAGVRQHVLAQVARRRVAVAARRARVRRLVGVDVHVTLHRARLREPFLADAALVPAFSGVHLQAQHHSTHTHSQCRFTALCPGLPGWAGTRTDIHT